MPWRLAVVLIFVLDYRVGCECGPSPLALDDGGAGIDGGPDASVDAGPSSVWRFVDSQGQAAIFGSDAGHLTVVSGAPILAGDLVVMACDMDGTSDVTAQAPPLVLATLGPFTTPGGVSGLLTRAFWAVAPGDLSGLVSDFDRTGGTKFFDCTVDLYRTQPGAAPPVLVDRRFETGTGDGGVPTLTCGPVVTRPGGVVFYDSVIWGWCVGPPLDPAFTQRQVLQGNPTGDLVPADGGTFSTAIGGCQRNDRDYSCLALSFGN